LGDATRTAHLSQLVLRRDLIHFAYVFSQIDFSIAQRRSTD
jgi:hypothetical protein